MQRIQKKPEPSALRRWRNQYKNDINFGYGLLQSDLREIIVTSLLEEQGELCAYTGRRIEINGCHIEHINPQKHCAKGEDVAYSNIVACYPAPNTGEAPYGAHQKKDWPSPSERHLFISPLEKNCTERFNFTYTGHIKPTRSEDEAACKTIEQLKLDYQELIALRRAAIQGSLQPKGEWLSLQQAQRRLKGLQAATGRLEPFSFVLMKALDNHIRKLQKPSK